jgi:hypothetical protein
MRLYNVLTPTVWVALVIANVIFGIASSISGAYEMAGLNILSAVACYVSYLAASRSKRIEK